MRSAIAIAMILLAAVAVPSSAGAQSETTLILATALPPGNPLADQVLHPWADRVNKAGAGVLKIDVRDGFAIANLNNSYDRVVADVVQISWLTHSNFAGKFKRSNVGGLPFVSDRSEEASVAMWRLYKTGLLDPEYDEVQPIMMAVLSQAGFHFRTAPPSFANLKGLKVIPPSKETGELAQLLGMAPIVMAVSQTYEALQRGTVDGVMLGWTAILSFKLQEVTTYHADAALGTTAGMLFISKKRYEALPPAAKKVLDAFSGEQESRNLGKFWDRLQSFGDGLVKGMPNQTLVTVPPDLIAKWRGEAEPIVKEWAKATPDGPNVLAAYRRQLADATAGH
ncbi:MAG TPA: TRAP transporter substrate-binding protein [Stellaceae bacterium]|jgi:TRAP-type C4-dicarboxylate transport system substrate-binding protein